MKPFGKRTKSMYRELECRGCKQTFMITEQAMNHPEIQKKCPHCGSRRVEPTGQYGFPANEHEIRDAMAQAVTTLKGSV